VADKLTFGDDQSSGSQTAWEWIVHQKWPAWNLDVVTVEQDGKPSPDSPLGYEALREFTPVEPRIPPTDVGFAEIRYLSAQHDPRIILGTCPHSTLLVVGPRGRGLLKSLHIGSTTEWLMQCPSTPLVIARRGEPVRQILIGMDGSRHAHAAVELLARMPWIAGAQITIVSVLEELTTIQDDATRAAQRLAGAGAHVNVLIIEPDPSVQTVNPRKSIMEVADASAPQLIVMGTQGLTGLPRLRLGSVASAVAHHVSCSVMLVRDTSDDD
jgi:nucleotide-binding universal stress UspA family protein